MTDELMSEVKAASNGSNSIITVMGVGGAGGNAVNHMWELGIHGVNFMVCNTDQQALDQSPVPTKVCLGSTGLGAGNVPENGRAAAVESLPEIRARLEESGTRMVFITAGMGGGTGTGASPVIAKLAREMELLTVAIVTSPLAVEGLIRYDQAVRGIEELRKNVDAILIINNDSILDIYGDLSLGDAFRKANDILASAAKGISEIITIKSDLVNVDFADVWNVMHGQGRIHMAVATAEGENRAQQVAEDSLQSPLLDHNRISGAKHILLNISVSDSKTFKTSELNVILNHIQSHASTKDKDGVIHSANIIWGTSVNPQLGSAMQLMIVATGFDDNPDKQLLPSGRTIITPVEQEAKPELPTSQLESYKQSNGDPASPRFPAEPVVLLGEKSTRYKDINRLKSTPAYQTRNSKFVVQAPGTQKETMQGTTATPQKEKKADNESQLPFTSN